MDLNFKTLSARITSLALILFSFYQVYLSIRAIFFIYPHLSTQGSSVRITQLGLIEKALAIYATMVLSGIFGLILLFKPSQNIRTIHIILGVIIFLAAAYFTVRTPFNSDPVSSFLFNLL